MQDNTLDSPAGERVPAVVYAAKSTADHHGSIPTQITDCERALAADGRERLGEPQIDEGFSGYKGNRGPGLEAAKRLAIEAAVEHGDAEIWVQHSDRLARGDGITADHLAELFFALRRQGVRLRSVQDDSTFENAVLAVVMGERNTEDSRRKSAATRAGKRRRFESGKPMGGPTPDGYRLVIDPTGTSRYEIDEARALIVRSMFERAVAGATLGEIARALNAEGNRTATRTSKRGRAFGGKPFDRRRVYDTLTTPIYCGRVVYGRGKLDQEVRDGEHPALVSVEAFERVQVLLAARNTSPDHNRRRGRPPTRYALAGLAKCGACGSTMFATTSTYKRKDGTRSRSYVCANVRIATGQCNAPRVDGEALDRAVIAHLDGFFLDFDRWLADVTERRRGERKRVEVALEGERADLTTVDRRRGLVRADYVRQLDAGQEGPARVASEALDDLDLERRRVERRVSRLDGRLAELPDEAPVDLLLDFYNDLSAAVRGTGGGPVNLADVNERLRVTFEAFWLDSVQDDKVLVTPVLLPSVVPEWADTAYLAISGNRHSEAPWLHESEREPIGMVVTGDERIVPPVRTLTADTDPKSGSTFV